MAEFIHRGVQCAKEVNASGIGKKVALPNRACSLSRCECISAVALPGPVLRAVFAPCDACFAIPCIKLVDFKAALKTQQFASIKALKSDVEAFASQFPTIGFDESSMKYP